MTVLLFLLALAAPPAEVPIVPRWTVHEIVLQAATQTANPYLDTEIRATVSGPAGVKQEVRGFWDGERTFRIRLTPTAPGTWRWVTRSSDAAMNGRQGSLRVTAAAPGTHGFLRRDSTYPTSFIHDDGNRPYIWGQTYYELVRNAVAGNRWRAAVENTAVRGMNKIRFVIEPPSMVGIPTQPNAYPQAAPFLDQERLQLNLVYWRKIDEVVRFIGDHGVLADLILFIQNIKRDVPDPQDLRYVRYAIARYAAFPQVMWCLSNEWNYRLRPISYWHQLGALFAAEDPWARQDGRPRALSIHQQTRPDFQFFDQPWLSHAILQFGVRNRGPMQADKDEWKPDLLPGDVARFRHGDRWGNYSIVSNWGHHMPVVNDEYGYFGEPSDQSEPPAGSDRRVPALGRDKHRNIMWGIATGAGFGSAGDKNIYRDGSPYFTANWHEAPEYGDIQRLVGFFTTKGIEFWKLAPLKLPGGTAARAYAAAEPGRQYVVYTAVGGRVALPLPAGRYGARLYDPRTGVDTPLATLDGGAARTLTVPAGSDWVVYVRRTILAAR